jgi:hypothetical protein
MFTKKFFAVIIAASLFNTAARTQTLFTYGTNTVSKDEFLKAFNKNPDTTGDNKSQKMKE